MTFSSSAALSFIKAAICKAVTAKLPISTQCHSFNQVLCPVLTNCLTIRVLCKPTRQTKVSDCVVTAVHVCDRGHLTKSIVGHAARYITDNAKFCIGLAGDAWFCAYLGFKLTFHALRLCKLAAEVLLISCLQLQLGCECGCAGLRAVQLSCTKEEQPLQLVSRISVSTVCLALSCTNKHHTTVPWHSAPQTCSMRKPGAA